MSKQANPTLVGGFVVGAVTLALSGVLAFGGGSFLAEDDFKMVAHFQSSVTGLNVGAPVRLRGVQVGRVSAINAVWVPQESESILIPVELTFMGSTIRAETPEEEADLRRREPLEIAQALIEQGLRAELQMDSIVTGKLYVALEFRENVEPYLVGGTRLPEIPTAETGFLKIRKTIEEFPLDETISKVLTALDAIEEFAVSGRLGRVTDNLDELITEFRALVRNVDEQVNPVSESALATMDDLRGLIRSVDEQLLIVSTDVQDLIKDADAELGPLAESATATLEETRQAVSVLEHFLAEDPTLLYRTAQLLEELTETARAVRTLADYLERHPEALLKGKRD